MTNSIKYIVILSVVMALGSATSAFAWEEREEVDVMFDSYNMVTGVVHNGETVDVDVFDNISLEDLGNIADISPASGELEDIEAPLPAYEVITMDEEIYFD